MNQMFIIYLHAKDPFEAKHQLLINKRERTGLKYLNDSNDMMTSTKILKNKTQIKNEKHWLYLTWLLICLVIKSLIR